MATPAEAILSRPRSDVIDRIQRPIDRDSESAMAESVRLTLISHELIGQVQAIETLPPGHSYRVHEESEGEYFIEQEIAPNVIYGYALKGGRETSSHFHRRGESEERPDITENIICVDGLIAVKIGNNERVLKAGEGVLILPEHWHSVRAIKDSIVAAVGQNSQKFPRDQRHSR